MKGRSRFFHRIRTVPSFFVDYRMEFLFGQQMEPIFSKVYQTRALWRHNVFGKLLYFQTHATDVLLR